MAVIVFFFAPLPGAALGKVLSGRAGDFWPLRVAAMAVIPAGLLSGLARNWLGATLMAYVVKTMRIRR